MIRVGVVGANWGLSHVAAWRSVPDVEVAAICTAHRDSAEAVARTHAIPRAYWDVAALLADEALDVVDATPRPSIRAPIVARALAAGKHVLQPLPFALDLGQAAALEGAAATAGVVAAVEVLHRHAPAFVAAKTLIEGGFLGKIYTIEGAVRTGILLNRPPDYGYAWIVDPVSGASALRNFGAHLLHVLTWLFGDVGEVAASLATHEREVVLTDGTRIPNGTADTAFALLRYACGASGSLHTSWCTPAAAGFQIDATGSAGRIVLRATRLGPDDAVLLTARRDAEMPEPVAIPVHPRSDALAAMCAKLAAAIRTGDRTGAKPDFPEAHRVMRIVEAAYDAAARGTWVRTA